MQPIRICAPGCRTLWLALLAVGLASSPLRAAPFTVSSPQASAVRKLKLEVEQKTLPGAKTDTMPKLQIKLPVRPGLDVALKAHWRTVERAGRRQSGFGDMALKSKWTIRDAGRDGGRLALAIEPELSLPTGRGLLGDGRPSLALPLILGVKDGAWTFGAELGFVHHFGPKTDKAYAAVLAQRRVAPGLSLGGELVHDRGDAFGGGGDLRAAAGLKAKLSKRVEVQALAGRSLHRADGQAENRFKLAVETLW